MSDLEKMRRLASVVAPTSALHSVLNEVSRAAVKVNGWHVVPTSGNAVCTYDTKTDEPRSYIVRYQSGNIGNLVHELIHVAVNESYRQDFVNFPARNADPPAPTYDAIGHRTNEFERQSAFMRANGGAMARITATLQSLTGWANASMELSAQQRSDIAAKFGYGMQWPHKEYDTVITQVLVWLFEWGFPVKGSSRQKPVVNALHEELEKVVRAAWQSRQQALQQSTIADAMQARRRAMGYGR